MKAQEPAQHSTHLQSDGTGAVAGPNAPTAPPLVPDYELIRRIGGGAYGDVWLARSTTGVLRAVKIVWRHTFEDERPFQREFEGIQHFERLSREHPSQLALFHVGRNEAAGYFYYVMELADALERIDGLLDDGIVGEKPAHQPRNPTIHSSNPYQPHTLRHDLQANARLPAARVLEIGLALTEALSHLHTNGLVHRDVKPSNIIFVGGKPKLADIGLVTDAGDTRSIVGTEGYLAPEGPGTPSADLFALGKVLYEAATGLDRRQLPQLPCDLRAWPDAKLVFELNEIFLKACETDPRRRYASADALREDLALLQRGQSVKRRRAARRRWVACKKIGLVAVGLAVSLFILHRFRDPDLHSANPEVNQLVEQGNLCALSATPERLATARNYFNRAVLLDPKFAPAYVGLFRVRLYEKGGGFESTYSDAEPNVRAAAMKLMEIDPSLAEAQSASAFIKYLDGHSREALAEAQKATQMRSGSREGRGLVHLMYGWYLMNAGDPNPTWRTGG